jgi:hypothetical protein
MPDLRPEYSYNPYNLQVSHKDFSDFSETTRRRPKALISLGLEEALPAVGTAVAGSKRDTASPKSRVLLDFLPGN